MMAATVMRIERLGIMLTMKRVDCCLSSEDGPVFIPATEDIVSPGGGGFYGKWFVLVECLPPG
jgi:hypothetical protein